jgi:hypothetical protein
MAETTKKTAAAQEGQTQSTRERLGPVKADVSFNDLEKDLDKGNERVLDLLNEHLVKQGYYNPEDPSLDDEQAEQNDPENTVEKHSSKLSADAVAAVATQDREKQDKERQKKLENASENAKKAREERIKKYKSDDNA